MSPFLFPIFWKRHYNINKKEKVKNKKARIPLKINERKELKDRKKNLAKIS